MELAFTKMHGLGNDFVVLDFIDTPRELTHEQIRFIADRHFGIGCDQVLVLQHSKLDEADVRYRIFNADGDEVEQCGNGARCIAQYLRENRGVSNERITAETLPGLIHLYCEGDNVRVDMGSPSFEPQSLPMRTDAGKDGNSIILGTVSKDFIPVSMGNPHAVFVYDEVEALDLQQLGPIVQGSDLFPESVNVGFMQVIDSSHIRLRVFERGVGETLACGTGACAAVVAGIRQGDLDNDVTVTLNGGDLLINWQGKDSPVWMTGSATTVFTGTIDL